jgi:hypothetical protein
MTKPIDEPWANLPPQRADIDDDLEDDDLENDGDGDDDAADDEAGDDDEIDAAGPPASDSPGP